MHGRKKEGMFTTNHLNVPTTKFRTEGGVSGHAGNRKRNAKEAGGGQVVGVAAGR